MKKLAVVLCSLTCITSFSCLHRHGDTSLRFRDSEHYFLMNAYFDKNRTRDVDEYMDRRIGNRSNMSFVNSRIDGTLALDDHTTFYIKKYPGFVEIKLDKDENSTEAYWGIRSMCEGIKHVLIK